MADLVQEMWAAGVAPDAATCPGECDAGSLGFRDARDMWARRCGTYFDVVDTSSTHDAATAASAAAKARVLIDVSTATGPPEEFGLDEPSGEPPTAKTTLTLPIDKLAFKVSQRVTSRANQPRGAMACCVRQHLTRCLRCTLYRC